MDTIPHSAQEGNPTKVCSQCKHELPATAEYFVRRSDRSSGLSSRCKACQRLRNHNYYREHLDDERARSREYQQEHHDKHIENSRRWRQENPEKRLAYKQEHHEEILAYNKWYRQTPQGKISGIVHSHKRRARLKSIPGSFTAQEFAEQVKRQKGKCYWCQRKLIEIHADHVIPITRPGSTNYIYNIVAACPECNLRKHNKMPHEWPEGGRLL